MYEYSPSGIQSRVSFIRHLKLSAIEERQSNTEELIETEIRKALEKLAQNTIQNWDFEASFNGDDVGETVREKDYCTSDASTLSLKYEEGAPISDFNVCQKYIDLFRNKFVEGLNSKYG